MKSISARLEHRLIKTRKHTQHLLSSGKISTVIFQAMDSLIPLAVFILLAEATERSPMDLTLQISHELLFPPLSIFPYIPLQLYSHYLKELWYYPYVMTLASNRWLGLVGWVIQSIGGWRGIERLADSEKHQSLPPLSMRLLCPYYTEGKRVQLFHHSNLRTCRKPQSDCSEGYHVPNALQLI